MKNRPLIKIRKGEKYYLKLTRSQKFQHYILMATFIVLVITGFPLKFYYYGWAGPIIGFFGGLNVTRTLHRVAAVTMVALFFFHWYYLLRSLFSQYVIPASKTGTFSWKELGLFVYYSPMFPRKKDLKDILDCVKYVTFLTNKRPQHERFHWKEKFDYWAVFWGIPVLGFTGLITWLPVWATSFMPGWAVNISYIVHSDEAMLAVSVIFIWHMYNAHVNYDKFPMSPLFTTGYLPEHLMKHEYYIEWARINKIVAMDSSRIDDMDAQRAAEELSNEQRLNMVREQIAFLKGEDPVSQIIVKQQLNHRKTYNSLGLLFAKRGDYDAAFKAFKKAGGEPRAYNNLGCLYMKKGEFGKAAAYFEKAIAANPSHYVTAGENLKKAKAALRGCLKTT